MPAPRWGKPSGGEESGSYCSSHQSSLHGDRPRGGGLFFGDAMSGGGEVAWGGKEFFGGEVSLPAKYSVAARCGKTVMILESVVSTETFLNGVGCRDLPGLESSSNGRDIVVWDTPWR